jgi:ribosomal subunit interface protein
MTNIKATNIELTEAIREYIEKRLLTAEKFVKADSIENAYVIVGKTTNHHKNGDVFRAEFNMVIGGKKFIVFSEKEDLFAAIDDAHDQLVREITSSNSRTRALFRRGAQKIKAMIRYVPHFYNKSKRSK